MYQLLIGDRDAFKATSGIQTHGMPKDVQLPHFPVPNLQCRYLDNFQWWLPPSPCLLPLVPLSASRLIESIYSDFWLECTICSHHKYNCCCNHATESLLHLSLHLYCVISVLVFLFLILLFHLQEATHSSPVLLLCLVLNGSTFTIEHLTKECLCLSKI